MESGHGSGHVVHFLEHDAGAFYHSLQRIFGNKYRQSGFFNNQTVKTGQESAAVFSIASA